MNEPEFPVRLRGMGRVEVAAHGPADAEHLVEKELRRAWPAARAEILQIARAQDAPRIVDEFAITYRLTATVQVRAPGPDQAPREAFRLARGRLAGTRYRATAWEAVPNYGS